MSKPHGWKPSNSCLMSGLIESLSPPKEKFVISEGLSLEKRGTQSIPLLLTFKFPLIKKVLSDWEKIKP